MLPSVEDMKWKLFKVFPLGDWQANVDSWDDRRTKNVYLYLLGKGVIK